MGLVGQGEVPPPPGDEPQPMREAEMVGAGDEGRPGEERVPVEAAWGGTRDLHPLPRWPDPDHNHPSPPEEEVLHLRAPGGQEVIEGSCQPKVPPRMDPPHPIRLEDGVGFPQGGQGLGVHEDGVVARQRVSGGELRLRHPRPVDLPPQRENPHRGHCTDTGRGGQFPLPPTARIVTLPPWPGP